MYTTVSRSSTANASQGTPYATSDYKVWKGERSTTGLETCVGRPGCPACHRGGFSTVAALDNSRLLREAYGRTIRLSCEQRATGFTANSPAARPFSYTVCQKFWQLTDSFSLSWAYGRARAGIEWVSTRTDFAAHSAAGSRSTWPFWCALHAYACRHCSRSAFRYLVFFGRNFRPGVRPSPP